MDTDLGETAVRLGYLTSAQLEECVAIRRQLEHLGVADPLSTILIKKKYLKQDQLGEIRKRSAGRAIEGFELLEKIGSGGMGTVYKALQTGIGRIVALKILKPDLAREVQSIERFVREARAVAKLAHKNIVMAYDVGVRRGLYFMVMEFVEGRTLGQILQAKGPLEPREALGVALELAGALAYIHENRMIHRDIKPENVLVTLDGVPKLCDLGLARSLEGADCTITAAGRAMGTPNYIAPEQIHGRRDIDIRCDIYAFGGTLYAMLTGRPPYSGATPLAVMYKHLNEPVPDPRKVNPRIPPAAARIVMKCMAKEREQRYSSPKPLLADLERALEARPATPPVRSSKPLALQAPRRSPILPVVAGLIAAGLVGTILLIPSRPRPELPKNATRLDPPKEAPKASPEPSNKAEAPPPEPPPPVAEPPKAAPEPPKKAEPLQPPDEIERPLVPPPPSPAPADPEREKRAAHLRALAHMEFELGQWSPALSAYERLLAEFADTSLVRNRKSELEARLAECLSRLGR
jgi:serine/threonine-protein kinase